MDDALAYELAFQSMAEEQEAKVIRYAQDQAVAIAGAVVGSGQEWNDFARWAAKQGGELARFVTEGKADASALRKQMRVERYEAEPTSASAMGKMLGGIVAGMRPEPQKVVVNIPEIKAPEIQTDKIADAVGAGINAMAEQVRYLKQDAPVIHNAVHVPEIKIPKSDPQPILVDTKTLGLMIGQALAQAIAQLGDKLAKPTPRRRRKLLKDAQGEPIGWEEEDIS